MCKKLFAWAENVRSVFCPEPTVDLPNTEGKAEEVVVYKYNSLPITFESADGRIMVNATQMVAPFKKTVRDWTRLKSTQDFLEALSTDKHICLSLLINTIKGGNGEQGTWMQEDVALEFARWINPLFGIWCNDRIRELLKHGITATPDTIEKMLSNPDFAIGVFSKLKEERAAKEKAIEERLAAEQKAISLEEEVGYKEAVIEGLVKEIPLADLRQRICDIVRKRGGNAKLSWSILYEEFGKKFHINVKTRMKRRKFIGNTIDFIEKELKMLPELYELTCKLFESEYDQLISDWGRFAQDVQNTKIK